MKHLDYAFDSKNQIWRYIVVFILTFAISNTIGAIPLAILIIIGIFKSGGLSVRPENMMDFTAYGINQNVGLAALMFAFVIALGGFILLLRWFHNRTLRGTINGTHNIRWDRILFGFAVWAVMIFASLTITYFTDPNNIKFQFQLSSFIPLFFIAIILIPFQTSFEEVTMRGYLMQGIATNTSSRIWALIITSLIFGLLHSFNPEVKEYGFFAIMPQYIGFGLMFGLVTLLDDGIELALGIHAANNILSSLFMTNKSSALQTAAVFNIEKINPYVDTLLLFVFAIIVLFIFSKKYKWNWKVLSQRVEIKTGEEQSGIEEL